MQVSRIGYYSWRNRGKSARDQERARLPPKVKEIHKTSRGERMAVAVSPRSGNPSVLIVVSTDFEQSGKLYSLCGPPDRVR